MSKLFDWASLVWFVCFAYLAQFELEIMGVRMLVLGFASVIGALICAGLLLSKAAPDWLRIPVFGLLVTCTVTGLIIPS